MWGELCLPLHTHPSALWRGTLEVLAPKKAKEREGGGGRDEGAEGAGGPWPWVHREQEHSSARNTR